MKQENTSKFRRICRSKNFMFLILGFKAYVHLEPGKNCKCQHSRKCCGLVLSDAYGATQACSVSGRWVHYLYLGFHRD
jgi:hypothetical protein